MLKPMIEKLDDVAEALRALYKQGSDGKFYLEIDIDQHPRFKALEANKGEILDEKKKLQQKLDEQAEKLRKDKVDGHISAQEFEQAKALMQSKFEEDMAKVTASLEATKNQLKTTMVDNVVTQMAAQLSGDNAHLMAPILRGRLEIVDKDGQLKLFVKDASGNVSNMTVEQLQKEVADDKRYAAIVKGRDSSGGNSNGNGGGNSNTNAEFEKFFDRANPEYSLTKQAELQKSHPDVYKVLADKHDPLKPLGMKG